MLQESDGTVRLMVLAAGFLILLFGLGVNVAMTLELRTFNESHDVDWLAISRYRNC